jgi:hypothetical protein
MEVVLSGQSATPVYYPNKKTAETLSAAHDNAEFENIYIKPPSGRLLFHWLEISRMHYLIDQAVAQSEVVSMPTWYNEWEPINKDAHKPSDLFSLYTVLDDKPPLSCAPDAGFLLAKSDGNRKAFYLEADRGTDSIKRISKKKPKGYAELAKRKIHRSRHFPDDEENNIYGANRASFSILFVTTTKYRRDELVARAEKFEAKSLWKFACRDEVKPETFFCEPIWHAVDTEPHTLIRA